MTAKRQPSASERRALERVKKLQRELAAAKRDLAKAHKMLSQANARAEEAKRKHAAELDAARARNPPAAAPPAEIAKLPPPPEDPLKAQAYAHHMLMLSLYNAATDPKISDRERRKEMRTIAANAAKLVPRSRIAKAEGLVLQNQKELAMKASERRGAKLQKLPTPQAEANAAITEVHGEEPRT